MQATPIDFDRHLRYDGCFNFRDLGGYATLDGRWVRAHRLYRADAPHALTERDRAGLQSLELATVIDLRTDGEIADNGGYVAALGSGIGYRLPLAKALPEAEELETWIDPLVVARHYRAMLDGADDTIAEILAILSDPSAYPSVFHCSAGKDRTGIVAAILLGIVGVADETIVADYALSSRAMTRLIAHLRTSYPEGSRRLDQLASAIVAAEPAAMAAFIAGLRADYGTFDDYAEALGMGAAPRFVRDALLTT